MYAKNSKLTINEYLPHPQVSCSVAMLSVTFHGKQAISCYGVHTHTCTHAMTYTHTHTCTHDVLNTTVSLVQWNGLRCENRLVHAESTVNNQTIGPELQVAMAEISSM